MKQILLFSFLFPLWILNPQVDKIDQVAVLLKDGDTKELFKMFSTKVELTILDEGNVYSNVQAQIVLNNFFNKNQPKSMKMIHVSNTNQNHKFAVILLNTSTGYYRTFYSLKKIDGGFYLTDMRIELEKTK